MTTNVNDLRTTVSIYLNFGSKLYVEKKEFQDWSENDRNTRIRVKQ